MRMVLFHHVNCFCFLVGGIVPPTYSPFVWRIVANFGSKDIDKKCFDAIYSAKVGVKTTVENEEFEEFNDEHMIFTIESASLFQM